VKPGVVCRLAAARLVERDLHGRTDALEHPDDGHADVRVDLVDETRMKQLNVHHLTVALPPP